MLFIKGDDFAQKKLLFIKNQMTKIPPNIFRFYITGVSLVGVEPSNQVCG